MGRWSATAQSRGARHGDSQLSAAAAAAAPRVLAQMRLQEVANTIWSLAVLQVTPRLEQMCS